MSPTSPFILLLVAFVGGLGFISSAPLAYLIAAAVPLVALMLLWPPGTLPILLIPVVMQWLQVSTKAISAALQGVPISYLADRGANLEAGFFLASLGLLSLVIGLRLGFGRPPTRLALSLREDLRRMNESDVYAITLTCLVIGYVAEFAAGLAGGVRQVFLAIADVKLSAVFLIVAWSAVSGKARLFAAGIVVFEVGLGMMGFFAEFRETLIVTVVALVAAAPKVRLKTVIGTTVVTVLTLTLAVFWSAVKPEYRLFANRGTGQQVVDRTIMERVDFLSGAAINFSGEQAADGLSRLIERVSYIDFFSHSLDGAVYSGNEGGEQTINAIMHVLIPRLIYPDKPPLPNDTMVTARYTGLQFQPGEAASISLGYQGELYADFGSIGFLFAVAFLGAIIGKCCLVILRYRGGSLALNVSLSILPLTTVMMFEIALIKLVGALLTSLVGALLLQRYALPYILGSQIVRRGAFRPRAWRR